MTINRTLKKTFSSVSLANVENLTRNFRQFVQICGREKKREKIMASAKVFALQADAKSCV